MSVKYKDMSEGVFYKKVKTLVDDGKLSVQLLISPPRTCSSMLEHMIGRAPEINVECHEPFFQVGYNKFGSDEGYKNIYDSIKLNNREGVKNQIGIVVKEMSYWINEGEEYKKLFELTNKPIIALIRNPLLTMESKIKKVIEAIDMRERIKTQQWLLNYVAKENGFNTWHDYIASPLGSDFSEKDSVVSFFENGETLESAYNNPTLDIQNKLLDHIARKDGYESWRELLRDKLYLNRDYCYFEDILKIDNKRFNLDVSGFATMEEQISYLESIKKQLIVIDSTDLRAMPESQMREICESLKISYVDAMIKWGDEKVDFHTEQKRPHDLIWYNELYSSTEVNPPNEIPPAISEFPKFVQDFIKSIDLPVYARLSQKKIGRENEHNFNEFNLSIDVVKNKIRELSKLGVVSADSKENKQLIELKMIDPVYAVTNQSDLFYDEKFRKTKSEYFDAINIVHEEIKKIRENKENKIYGFEKKIR